jgi:hypothetical protein
MYKFRIICTESLEVKIPKMIWTYWEGDPPEIVNKCIETWKSHNPDIIVVILNNESIIRYLPDLKISELKLIDTSQRLSDIIRVNILAKYGGIWSDASIICKRSYDYIFDIQQETSVEFIGYYLDLFTKKEYLDYSPVIENWFFACVPNSKLMVDWRNKLMESQNYDSISEYIDYLAENTDFQNIENVHYLWMHGAIQNCLQGNKGKYNFHAFKAEDGPYRYLTQNEWDSEIALNKLIECTSSSSQNDPECDIILDTPIIKLRGAEREKLESMDYNKLF